MNKSEIIKKIKQYGNTYVVRYKYHEDGFESNGYYCTDSYGDLTKEIKEHFDIEEGDEFEILYIVPNNFNYDDYLSDAIIAFLKGDSEIEDEDYAQDHIAYIDEIYNECRYKKDEADEYKRNIMTSVLKYMDLRKRSPMIKYVADEILKIFGIKKDNNLNVRKQIELTLDAQANDNVLSQLISPNHIKSAQRHLDRIGKAYMITEEESLYRVGVLFLRIHKAFCDSRFLKPQFIDEGGGMRNYTKFMKLIASYYGIKSPTYREQVLRSYKEKGDEHTLLSVIKKEHREIWNSIL